MKRLGRKRLSVDIPDNLHKALVKISRKRKITITKYVLRALIRYSLHENKYDEEIELLNEYR